MNILVTGVTGFVGGAVAARLVFDGQHRVRGAIRAGSPRAAPTGVNTIQVESLGAATDWRDALAGCDAVVHAAARVHDMGGQSLDLLAEFRTANVAGTIRLARQAHAAGVSRFVFISSIKVNGEETRPGRPFTPEDAPAPSDPYGISKHEAEVALHRLAAETGLDVVIIRPVLVYGPGVEGNFRAMMRVLNRGLPLPLGALTGNRRSLVAIENLVDLITVCLSHPLAAGRTFLVSDGQDLSTAELLRRLAAALGRPARLLPVPTLALRAVAAATGRSAMARRLCGSLQVDTSSTRNLLNWFPPVRMEDALHRTARHFLESCRLQLE